MSCDVSEPGSVWPPDATRGSAHRVLRNSTLNLVAFGLNAASNLLALVFLARKLGVEEFGRYYTLYALMLLVQLVSEAGIPTVLTCRIATQPGRWPETAAEALGLLVVTTVASLAGLLGVGGVWVGLGGDPGVLMLVAWVGLACAAMHVQRFCCAVFQAFEQFLYESVAKVLQAALFVGLVAGLPGGSPGGLGGALAMFAASHVTAAVFLAVGLKRHWRRPAARLNRILVRDWVGAAGPLGLADVLRRLTWQVDTLLVGLLQPAGAVGIYSVATRPLATLNWVPHVILMATLPSFARMAAGGGTSLGVAFSTSLRLLWVTSVPVSVSLFACAEPVVILLAGREYLEAALPMRLLIWITNLLFLSVPFRFLFAALGRPRTYALLAGLVLALGAGLEAALIPRWGYLGACAGAVVGELAFTAAGLACSYRLGFKGVEWNALGRAALAGVAMGAVLWPARGLTWLPLTLAGILSVGFYFALCVLLGALRWDEARGFFEALAWFFCPATGRSRSAACPKSGTTSFRSALSKD